MRHVRVGHRDVHSGSWEASGDPWEKHGAVVVLVTRSCPTVWTPCAIACQAPLHGILQARILEWIAVVFSRGSSQPRVSCIAGRFFTIWAKGKSGEAVQQDSPVATLRSPPLLRQPWRLPTGPGYFARKRTVRNSEQLSIYSGFSPPPFHSSPVWDGCPW